MLLVAVTHTKPVRALTSRVPWDVRPPTAALQRRWRALLTYWCRTNFARRVLVLRHGTVIEQGAVEQIFNHAASAYTRKLIEAIPGRHEVALAVTVTVAAAV
ncbi:putative ABC transporter ATP-binding protein [Pseudomonas syringae pv. atrofaciens]|nr:putative ABC transporter ATP-binding protein [Pseudomonas syringae pv. atrofaciens]